jgi:tetratricopeptide (TPR) repeat protein
MGVGNFSSGNRGSIDEPTRTAVLKQLERLPASAQLVLPVASAFVGEFDFETLKAALKAEAEPLKAALKCLVDSSIVIRTDKSRYRFAHAMFRKAVYDALAEPERVRIHRRIGEALEELHGVADDEYLELRADHFKLALEPETLNKAIDYSMRASKAAFDRHDFARAGSYGRAALGMMTRAGSDPARRAKLLYNLADELFSNASEAIAYLEAALPLFESLGKTRRVADCHIRLARFLSAPHLGCMDIARAMGQFAKAEALLTGPEDQAELMRLYQQKGVACIFSMETDKGLELTRRSMELAEQLQDDFWWIQSAMIRTRFLIAQGQLAESNSLELRAREKAERFEDPYSGSVVAWLGGHNCSDLWDPRAALSKNLAELSKPRTSRSPTRSLPILTDASHMYVAIGEMEEARRVLTQIRGPGASTALPWEDGDWDRNHLDIATKIELARRDGNLDSIGLRTHWLGFMARMHGSYEESEAFQKESLEISRRAPHLARVLWSEMDLCLLYFDTRRRDDAHRSLQNCRNILAPGEEWRGLEGGVARAQAVVHALDRRFNDADTQFQKALEILERYSKPWEQAQTYRYWGRALVAAGDKLRAVEKFQMAIDIYRRIGAGEAWTADVMAELSQHSPIPCAPSIAVASEDNPCSFRLEGEYWTISHRTHTFRLKDMKGLRYIAHLLAHPGEQFHVHDLVTSVEGAPQFSSPSNGQVSDLRISDDLGDAGAILDPQSKSEYRRRREELRSDLAEAEQANDIGRAESIRNELEILNEYLSAAMGLGGRDRKATDHSERTRNRVGKAIHSSLLSIRENDASLGHHLATCIRTGYLCAYSPDPEGPFSWEL